VAVVVGIVRLRAKGHGVCLFVINEREREIVDRIFIRVGTQDGLALILL
jgi:hypothetical protein